MAGVNSGAGGRLADVDRGHPRRRPSRPARRPQGAGRQHPLRHLPRAGPVAPCRWRRPTIAETLDLHPNTVRPHLERMREVGLLAGRDRRPRRRRPAAAPLLAGARRAVARPRAAAVPDAGPHAAAAGRGRRALDARRGRSTPAASRAGPTPGRVRRPAPGDRASTRCVGASSADASGSTPSVVERRRPAPRSAFAHCPFRELAEANPDLVCSLHRGLVEGFVDARRRRRGRPSSAPWSTATPCQVELALTSP